MAPALEKLVEKLTTAAAKMLAQQHMSCNRVILRVIFYVRRTGSLKKAAQNR